MPEDFVAIAISMSPGVFVTLSFFYIWEQVLRLINKLNTTFAHGGLEASYTAYSVLAKARPKSNNKMTDMHVPNQTG